MALPQTPRDGTKGESNEGGEGHGEGRRKRRKKEKKKGEEKREGWGIASSNNGIRGSDDNAAEIACQKHMKPI